MHEVSVVGAGLAGCEAALRLASFGNSVNLIEMRPGVSTPAHRTGDMAELVCSNSLKSDMAGTASGLLKQELRMLGCRLLDAASEASVPAGHALAVDRALFSRKVEKAIAADPLITVIRREQKDLELNGPLIVATGPLTSEKLSSAIQKHLGRDNLHFYDAISISVSLDSLDQSRIFKASRYDKGGADYWNVPLSKDEYMRLVEYLREAPQTSRHQFEDKNCFEACLPVEVAAARGDDVLRFGPLKPRGLEDPATGKEPWAVIQLRQESVEGTIVGLVGFQTRMTHGGQKGLMRLIPGFEGAEILRYGSIHRNSFLESPVLLDEGQMSRSKEGLFFAGQITGVEGYVESIAHGLLTAINLHNRLEGREYAVFPVETVLGGLQRHLSTGTGTFQPMNANFGLLPQVRARRTERKRVKSERSIEAMRGFIPSL